MLTIIYAASATGYCVQTLQNGRVVHEYRAGNHSGDSQAYVDPASPNAVSLATLQKFAQQTAYAIAREKGIKSVSHDADLEAELKESHD